MKDRMNDLANISPDQRSFLQAIQNEPDTLDRIVERINVVPWRLSAWMRRERFRKALAQIIKSMRGRRRLETRPACGPCQLVPLGPTGGHNDAFNGLDPELSHPRWADRNIDSPYAARKEVRVLRRMGVDLIKIMPSGGVTSIGDDPRVQTMTNDEITAVVETAHNLGMKVAAHAHGKAAIDNAVKLGVDSIEHGTYGDKEPYALMKTHGVYLVRQPKVDLARIRQALQQGVVQSLPDAGLLPVPQPTPQGHPAAAHLPREVLPGDTGLQHEDDPCQRHSVGDWRVPRCAGRPRRR